MHQVTNLRLSIQTPKPGTSNRRQGQRGQLQPMLFGNAKTRRHKQTAPHSTRRSIQQQSEFPKAMNTFTSSVASSKRADVEEGASAVCGQHSVTINVKDERRQTTSVFTPNDSFEDTSDFFTKRKVRQQSRKKPRDQHGEVLSLVRRERLIHTNNSYKLQTQRYKRGFPQAMEVILPRQRVGCHLLDKFNANFRLLDQQKKLKQRSRAGNPMHNTISLMHPREEWTAASNQKYILSIDSRFPNTSSHEETVTHTVKPSKTQTRGVSGKAARSIHGSEEPRDELGEHLSQVTISPAARASPDAGAGTRTRRHHESIIVTGSYINLEPSRRAGMGQSMDVRAVESLKQDHARDHFTTVISASEPREVSVLDVTQQLPTQGLEKEKSSHQELDTAEPSLAAEAGNHFAPIKTKEQTFRTLGTTESGYSPKAKARHAKDQSLANTRCTSPRRNSLCPDPLQSSSRTHDKSVGGESLVAAANDKAIASEKGKEPRPTAAEVDERPSPRKKPLWLVNKKPKSRVINHRQDLKNKGRYAEEGESLVVSRNRSPKEEREPQLTALGLTAESLVTEEFGKRSIPAGGTAYPIKVQLSPRFALQSRGRHGSKESRRPRLHENTIRVEDYIQTQVLSPAVLVIKTNPVVDDGDLSEARKETRGTGSQPDSVATVAAKKDGAQQTVAADRAVSAQGDDSPCLKGSGLNLQEKQGAQAEADGKYDSLGQPGHFLDGAAVDDRGSEGLQLAQRLSAAFT